MEGIKIKCKDCGDIFIFTQKDQKFYEEHQFVPPKRCKNCRDKRKKERGDI